MPVSVNAQIAQRFDEVAALIEAQNGHPFRARAYRHAADTLRQTQRSVRQILDTEGVAGLEKLPRIGEGLSLQIRIMLSSGRLPILERLRGEMDPEAVLSSVPGIGRKIAERLHHDLGIDTLEDLEAAANDGRLELLAGFGSKKIAGIIDCLQGRLARVRRRSPPAPEEPSVEEILSVDEEYRRRGAAGELKVIAPQLFNPESKAWLPILHTTQSEREYTALYSNTARAHQLGRTRDWVVVYSDHGSDELQYTVVTGRESPLTGKRVVRGREAECRAYYEDPAVAAAG